MKKKYILFLIIFGFLNIILLVFNIVSNNKIIGPINNDFVSFDIIDNYYMKEKYENDTKIFKLYGNDRISTINIYILNQPYSNNTLYTKEEVSRSINYQLLKNIEGYREEQFKIDGELFYSKNKLNDKIIETIIRYEGQNVLVLAYVTNEDLYDDSIIYNLNDNIKIKLEENHEE